MTIDRPSIERFVARFSEQEIDWPWIVRGTEGNKLPHRGAWEVLDVARGVVVKRGLSEDRAREAARFFCPGAPPIDHFAPDGYAIAIEHYPWAWEVWQWYQRDRWTAVASSDSAWHLVALCQMRQYAAIVGDALLDRSAKYRGKLGGPTAIEIWAPDFLAGHPRGRWGVADRKQLNTAGTDRDLDAAYRQIHTPPGTPGPVMPWHLARTKAATSDS